MTLGVLGTEWSAWAGIFFLLVFSTAIYLGWYFYFCGRSSGVLYSGIAAQVAFVGQVLGVMLVMGWLGILRPIPLAAMCALITTGVYLLGVRPHWRTVLDRNRAFIAWLRTVRVPLWAVLLGVLMAGLVARNIFWGWFLPPFQRDDIAYHLPILGNIIQNAAIRYFPSPAERISFFPINSELFQAWHFIFVGSDKLVDLAFLPGILAGGAALYGTSRRFGFSRRASLAGWAVFAFTPMVFLQQLGSYNDAWMASLFLCGAYLVVSMKPASARADDIQTAILAGICSGVILGTKFSGALSSLAIGVLILLFLVRRMLADRQWERPNSKAVLSGILVPLLVVLALTAAYGAYPLIRNTIHAGNPLAPVEVKIGSRILWEGKPEDEFLAIGSEEAFQNAGNGLELAYSTWFEREYLIYDPNNGGTGPLWLFIGIPGAILWVWESIRRRNAAAIALSILSLMILVFTPAQWRPRYMLPLLLLCGLGGALLFDALRSWPRRILAGGLVLAAAFVTIASLRPAPLEAGKAMALVFDRDDKQRNAAYVHPTNEFYEWVEERTAGAPAVIVYGRWVDVYPLFGSDLRNTVLSPAAYSAEAWGRALAESGADLVVVAGGSPEEEWTRESGVFTQVFQYDSWSVWEKN
ncbi:MAG: hypothetical protein JW748_03745 [Anaerolineales bacterium]|nr:hypothetical protein [Anaerolineales bacterium]